MPVEGPGTISPKKELPAKYPDHSIFDLTASPDARFPNQVASYPGLIKDDIPASQKRGPDGPDNGKDKRLNPNGAISADWNASSSNGEGSYGRTLAAMNEALKNPEALAAIVKYTHAGRTEYRLAVALPNGKNSALEGLRVSIRNLGGYEEGGKVIADGSPKALLEAAYDPEAKNAIKALGLRTDKSGVLSAKPPEAPRSTGPSPK